MELRAITDGEIAAFRHALITTFGGDPAHDPDGDERFRALIPAGRAFAAFDRGAVVATAASFAMSLTVPGGATLPMAGLTMVTVRPTHRRRGVLRRLIATHLADARDHGDPVSGLWASEASIYGRFGYGLAAEADELAFVATDHVVAADRTPDQLDDVDAITADDAAVLLPPVYDAVRRTRPAMYARSRAWWKHRRFADRPDLRGSNSPRRHAVTLRAGAVTGYVVYRQRLAWDAGVAAGKLEIEELLATDARAEATLWRFVAGIDLFPNVAWWNAPVDSPLPWLVADARRLRRRRTDTLWLRVEDVAATLAARTYAADGVVRVAVTDPGAAGPAVGPVVELRVEGGAAACVAVDGPAQLQLDRAALGSIFLGAFAPSRLARVGRITGEPAAIAVADRLFATPVAPWCPEIF